MNAYQQKLSNGLRRFAATLILLSAFVFTMFLLLYTVYYNGFLAKKYSENLVKKFEDTYNGVAYFLQSDELREKALSFMDGDGGFNDFAYFTSQFLRSSGLQGYVFLTDRRTGCVYSAFAEDGITEYNRTFNTYIGENLQEEELYTSVYYVNLYGEEKAYMAFAYTLSDVDGSVAGYLCTYVDFNYWLLRQGPLQADVLVTSGAAQKVVAATNRTFVDNSNQFTLPCREGMTYHRDGTWINTTNVSGTQLQLHTVVNSLPVGQYGLVGCLVVAVMTLIVAATSNRYAGKLAQLNSQSVAQLYTEMDKVNQGICSAEMDRRICLHTGDEIEEIARHVNLLMDNLSALHNRNLELERLNSLMEISQLEAKFDPHFLYNTLESIRYSISLDPAGADRIILDLTELLRYSLDNTSQRMCLADDMRYVENYLAILRFRFGKRLAYDIDISDESCDKLVPKLLLQPLIENSVKYGFKNVPALHIGIIGRYEQGTLLLQVQDNGTGPEEVEIVRMQALVDEVPNGLGRYRELQSLNRRLKLLYGPESGIVLESEPGHWIRVSVRIVYREGIA